MEIHFKIDHLKEVEEAVTPEIQAKAERKLLGLKKYLLKTEEVTHVYVELGKAMAQHTGDVWRAQINMDSLGTRYHADAVKESIQSAIDVATHELQSELRKSKKKEQNMFRRGGAAVKSFMRGFGGR